MLVQFSKQSALQVRGMTLFRAGVVFREIPSCACWWEIPRYVSYAPHRAYHTVGYYANDIYIIHTYTYRRIIATAPLEVQWSSNFEPILITLPLNGMIHSVPMIQDSVAWLWSLSKTQHRSAVDCVSCNDRQMIQFSGGIGMRVLIIDVLFHNLCSPEMKTRYPVYLVEISHGWLPWISPHSSTTCTSNQTIRLIKPSMGSSWHPPSLQPANTTTLESHA